VRQVMQQLPHRPPALAIGRVQPLVAPPIHRPPHEPPQRRHLVDRRPQPRLVNRLIPDLPHRIPPRIQIHRSSQEPSPHPLYPIPKSRSTPSPIPYPLHSSPIPHHQSSTAIPNYPSPIRPFITTTAPPPTLTPVTTAFDL